MAEEFLVRAYDVGVGDCLYVCIPDRAGEFHMLIDCGTLGPKDLLRPVIAHLETVLPVSADDNTKKQLDLLVITHRHKDHIIGVGMDIFSNIDVKHIWLSAAMNKEHPQAEGLHAFQDNVQLALGFLDVRELSPAAAEVVAVSSYPFEDEIDALENDFGSEPVYVHAGMASDQEFNLQDTRIHILGPEEDIDHFYLGELPDNGLGNFSGFSSSALASLSRFNRDVSEMSDVSKEAYPENISAGDFERLRARMMHNALAFAYKDNTFRNNTSIVLLMEWRGRRLLFTGDAEWHGAFKEGKDNGSWNVIWHERRDIIDGPIDFLKVGHHGSENATPWHPGNVEHEVNTILDSILPIVQGAEPSAQAIVSTRRKNYASIPGIELVRELGTRASNTHIYAQRLSEEQKDLLRSENAERFAIEETTLPHLQPDRTDFESLVTGEPFADISIPQSPTWQPS